MSMSIRSRADDCDKHQFEVNHMIFFNKKLYTAGDDGKIKMWAPDLRLLNQIQAHKCSVFGLAASKDTLYSCSNDGTVKSWSLDDLKAKSTLLVDTESEFWRISCKDNYLYVGDNQGNVRVYHNEDYFGVIFNIAEPIKDMLLDGHYLFVANVDITVSDVKMEETQQSIHTQNLVGKAPMSFAGSKLCFTDKEGRNIVVYERGDEDHWVEIAEVKGAHGMIIKAMAGANWHNKATLFTSGWDKIVKKWMIHDKKIDNVANCNVEIVVNCLTIGDEGEVYAAGGDGHIVLLQA